MNLFKRGMIFVTFFGSCLALALTVAALGTKYWITAQARRTSNPEESDGNVHFGLFEGRKHLNVAYGWRTYDINIMELVHTDRDLLLYGLWVATIGCLATAAIFSAAAAIFAVINTATNPYGTVTGVPGLYVWNTIAMLLGAAAVSLWVAQFYLKLQHNVMSKEDTDNMWTSANMASLGYSFWFVVGAAIIHLVNIVSIYVGTADTRVKQAPQLVIEEKSNGVIMLY